MNISLASKIGNVKLENALYNASGPLCTTEEHLTNLANSQAGAILTKSSTRQLREGNPKPRVFRHVATKSVINRMGFPNEGVEVFKNNIHSFRESSWGVDYPVGLNIGMNKDQDDPEKDYTLLIQEVGPYADYLAVNVSSPNTPGLRDLQQPEFLRPFLTALIAEKNNLENTPPLLVKLAPDLSDEQIKGISQVLVDVKIDGIILANTTLGRPTILPKKFSQQKGGLSGSFLKKKSTNVISKFYSATNGSIPIIGVGGVSSAKDVIDKMRAGASLVQLYTGLIYEGPELPGVLCKNIVAFLKENGYNQLSDLVGEDHRNGADKSAES